MATKKNQPSKSFQLGTFFLITTVILGILTIVLYKRVEVLKSEAHSHMREKESCEHELNKLGDCPRELDQTLEYQGNLNRELEQEKMVFQMQADSLKKVLLSLNAKAKSSKSGLMARTTGNSRGTNRPYVVSHQTIKEYEEQYNQKVMADVLRTTMKP